MHRKRPYQCAVSRNSYQCWKFEPVKISHSRLITRYSQVDNPHQLNSIPILQINDVICRRGYSDLFEPLSFTADSGDILQITGVNGSGKSTLIRALCGLHQPEHGEIQWHLKTDNGKSDPGSVICYLGHKSGLNGNLSARENLEFIANLFGVTNKKRVDYALERFDAVYYADLPAARLSAGQSQAISLCRLLLSPKPVWILDEPATSLDQTMIEKLVSLFLDHTGQNGLVIYTSHQMFPGIENTSTIELTYPSSSRRG